MWGFQKQGDMHEGALNASVPCQRCAKLVAALKQIVSVASGEIQVAIDDTDGMAWIDRYARAALKELGE